MGRDAHDASDFSDDEFDFDEYFASTYRPLSNLPTPPLSSKNSFTAQSPQSVVGDGEPVESSLLGPAVHLVNMLPPAASLATPSVPLVQAILSRAKLPLDTVALAVCILDSLDNKFSRHWRLSCPLARHDFAPGPGKRHTLPANPLAIDQLHIDSVCPEVIIVAALMIAVKFTEDHVEQTQHVAWEWGRQMWTCDQLNATERCIMESLHYRIMPLMQRDIIEDAMADMRRAGANAEKQQLAAEAARAGPAHLRSMSTGVAVAGLGLQLTPMDTPSLDEGCHMANLGDQPQAAFRQPSSITHEALYIPAEVRG